jgi:hypothetical protein
MFSRHCNAPAAAAMLVCFSVLILSAVLVFETSHAKNSVIPVLTPGDPDEFETSVSGGELGGGGRTPLSAGESCGEAGSPPRNVPREEVKPAGEALSLSYSALSRALKRFVAYVVFELDVR